MKAGHIAKTCRSNFYYLTCKGLHHACICRFKKASTKQNSQNSSKDGFTQIDKQNDDEKKTTVASPNIASEHPFLNLYHVSLVLLQTAQAHGFSCETKNGKNLRILFDCGALKRFLILS